MDSIVKKLSEIESAAAAIVEHAEAQKSILDKEYRDARLKFDSELEQKTSKHIQAIQNELSSNTKALLDSQSGENNKSIQSLHKEYEEKHTLYAQQILERITEV